MEKCFSRFVFQLPRRYFLFLLLVVLWFKTGIGVQGNFLHTMRIAQNPFVNQLQHESVQHLLFSWISPFLMWLLGVENPSSGFLLHLFFSLIFSLLFFLLSFRLLPEYLARIACVLFVIFPVSGTLYFWVGPDSLTLLLMMATLCLSQRSRIMVFVLGVILGMQHFEQSFCGVGALTAATFWNRKEKEPGLPFSLSFCCFWWVGIMVGKVVLSVLFYQFGLLANARSAQFWLIFDDLRAYFYTHFQWALWAGLGCGWLVVVHILHFPKWRVAFFTLLIPLVFLPFVALDYTRVVAIASFPLLAQYVFFNRALLAYLPMNRLAFLFLTWLLMPYVWFFIVPQSSLLTHDLARILWLLFGWQWLPENLVENSFVPMF